MSSRPGLPRVCVSMSTPASQHRRGVERFEAAPPWHGGVSPTVSGEGAKRSPGPLLMLSARKAALGWSASGDEQHGERVAVVAEDRINGRDGDRGLVGALGVSLLDRAQAADAGHLGSPARPRRRSDPAAQRGRVGRRAATDRLGGKHGRSLPTVTGLAAIGTKAKPKTARSAPRADLLRPEHSRRSPLLRRVKYIQDQLRGLEAGGRRSILDKLFQALRHPRLAIACFDLLSDVDHLQRASLSRRGELGPIDGLSCAPRLNHRARLLRLSHARDLALRRPMPSRRLPGAKGRSAPALPGLLRGAVVHQGRGVKRDLPNPRRHLQTFVASSVPDLFIVIVGEAHRQDFVLRLSRRFRFSAHGGRQSSATGAGSPSG